MNYRRLLQSGAALAAAAILALGAQGTALARGFGGGGGHGGFGGGGFGGHGFAARGFGGRGFAGRGYYGGYGRGWGGRGYYGGWGCCGWGWGWGAGLGLGLWLSVLPWDYETLWWDGVPYYYADNAYYQWDAQMGQYQQVQPPPQVAQQAAAAPAADTELFAYPKNGQSTQQQATDKAQCREWARGQSGYSEAPSTAPPPPPPNSAPGQGSVNDGTAGSQAYASTPAPAVGTRPVAGLAPTSSDAFARRANYLRAEAACLEGRGYSVR